MAWKPIARAALLFGSGFVCAELIYLLVANGVLWSGVIQRGASGHPDDTEMVWDEAWSPWPGRGYVSGFRLRVQDPVMQFRLTIAHAAVDVALLDLLHRTFHATRVRGDGVSYRFLTKVDRTAGKERRLEAFPLLEGFARPALTHPSTGPPPTAAEREAMWGVQLEDVDVGLVELWMLEYRYRGSGRARGGFTIAPLRTLRVGPATLQLDQGELRAGGHIVSSSFTAHADVTIGPVDLSSSQGLEVLDSLTTSVQFDTALADLGVADLYVPGLRAQGAGRLRADVEVADGRLLAGSAVNASLHQVDVRLSGYQFVGDGDSTLALAPGATAPLVHASLSGTLRVPVRESDPVVAAFSQLTAELAFSGNQLSNGLRFQRLSASVGEARVGDARAISRAVGTVVPILLPELLGAGPLLASGSAYATPDYALVRVRHASLGDARLEGGAAVARANRWSGAAAGALSEMPLGLRLHSNSVQAVLFPSGAWLSGKLREDGISAEGP